MKVFEGVMQAKAFFLVAALLTALSGGQAAADARELKQSELRMATLSGSAIRLNRVIKGVKKAFGGTPVDARAFKTDKIYYRILVKKPGGKIVSVIVNAETGTVVSNRSSTGREISEAARNSTKSKSNNGQSASATRGNSAGRSNAGGNGCQRRSKIRPLWRSKSRPVWGERLGACGPHIASPVQGALAVRPIL
jgi:uncharacterized membrane protein YkoI